MTQRLAGLILMPWLVSLCFAQEATSPPASVAVPPSSKTANDAPNPVKAASRAAGKPVTGQDRLNLDASVVTGNRELPRVLVIVPWKKADLGELNGKPSNSLLDEAVAPLDREVFRREILYYNAGSKPALTAPASGSSSGHD